MMNIRRHPFAFAGALLLLTMTAGVYAFQCPAGSVSASYTAPDNLRVTASIPGAQCNAPWVEVAVQGYNFIRTFDCGTNAGCTVTTDYDTSCFTPGNHTVTATFGCYYMAGSCVIGDRNSTATSFTVTDRTPTVNASVEQTSPTSIRIHMPYVFPNTNGSRGLKLEHFLPNGAGDAFFWTDSAPTPSGEWTHDFNITCWLSGVHRFVFTGTACDTYSHSTETSFTVPDETPSISASVVVTGPNAVRVDMPFSFPATAPGHADHSLRVAHFNPDGSGDGVFFIFVTDDRTGSWSQSFDTTCWPSGTHTFTATASTCNRTTATANATYEVVRRPHVSVSIQKTGAGAQTVLVSYNFPDNEPGGRSLVVEFLPLFPEVAPSAPYILHPVPDSSGTVSFPVPAWGKILRARASNSCGEYDVRDSELLCDCPIPPARPKEGPTSVPHPVRLWDGSMTYSESDPLPNNGLAAFSRNYDTLDTTDGWFGTGWRSAFNAGLSHFTDGPLDTVTIQSEGEQQAAFVREHGVWIQTWPSGITTASLVQQGDGSWQYRETGSTLIRLFRTDGHFAGFDDRQSATKVLLDYNSSGQPQRVYSADGTWSATITITGNHITSISVEGRPDLVWQYNYSGSLLQSVTLSGSSPAWRTYEYTGGLLSAVHDAAGNLIESHSYDAHGRAINSIGRDTTDITNIEYDLAGSLSDSTITRVTYATGEQATFEQRFTGGQQHTIATVGGCGGCGSRNATYAIDDATSSLLRKQDARGYISSFSYDAKGRLTQARHNDRPASCDPEQDANHCHMTPAGLASASLQATAASTYVTYAYGDLNWPDRATAITTPSVAKTGDTRTDTMTYDATTGVALTQTSTGWTNSTASSTRTTTVTLYDGSAVPAFNPGRTFSSSWMTLPQPAGKRRSVDAPRTDVSDVTTFVYYPIDNSIAATNRGRLAAARNAAGHITTFEDYNVFGNATRVVDANGVASELTFDALGRTLTSTLKAISGCNTGDDPLCATDLTTSRTYSPSTGLLSAQFDANGNATSYDYDSRGRLSTISRGTSLADLRERIAYTYDAPTGRKSMEQYLANTGGSWTEKRRESFAYDMLAQLSAQTHADSTSTAYTYDELGAIATVRDENHTAANTTYGYDPAHRLTSVKQTLSTAPQGYVTTSYVYDIAGNLTAVTDPNGNVTTYVYDDFGQMRSQTSPVTGTALYEYDLAGNLTASTDANGATTTRTYDALGRVTSAVSVCTGLDTETVSSTYDDATTGRFAIGRLASVSDPSGSTDYFYERRGMNRREDRVIGTSNYSTAYRYDRVGSRLALGALNYTYDYAGRPFSVSSGTTPLVSSATYLPFGPELELSFANGLKQTKSYDARYRIAGNVLTNASSVALARYSYTDDSAGNVTAIHDVLQPGFDRTFSYDDLNRLIVANSGSSLWGAGSYAYDKMGNVTSIALGTARNVSLTYAGTTSKLASMTENGGDPLAMTYDAAGNETASVSSNLPATYSCRNLLGASSGPLCDLCQPPVTITPDADQLFYDARGVRVRSIRGANMTETPQERHYLYTPELQLSQRIDQSLGQTDTFVWFGGHPVAQLTSAGGITSLRYTFTDHLGTPLLQTDTAASIVWRAEYEPYGNVHTYRAGSADDQPLRLPGQEYVSQSQSGTEEMYNIFRWYRAGWGRYTQPDPLAVGGLGIFARGLFQRFTLPQVGNLQEHATYVKDWGVGLYAYAANNPQIVIDRVGLRSLRCTAKTIAENLMPPERHCALGAICKPWFDPWDFSIAFGVITIPDCFQCPKICRFQANDDGNTLFWYDKRTKDSFVCEPWTQIVRISPTPADLF